MINYSILLEAGHFNFPQIGHYHFRATEVKKSALFLKHGFSDKS